MWGTICFLLMAWQMVAANPHVAIQTSFIMNARAEVASEESEECDMAFQKKYESSIDLRSRHLQSQSQMQEAKVDELYFELMGSERSGTKAGTLDDIEAALKQRHADLDSLLKATDAAILRKRAALQT
mmetsp:Transcript_37201/g.69412  ORF Transcript_37201/g.69412 Transcript_37201/m.69412 type:complete len:128 (+) Transcript_37201:67-450(+)